MAGAVHIELSTASSCALLANGTVACWGFFGGPAGALKVLDGISNVNEFLTSEVDKCFVFTNGTIDQLENFSQTCIELGARPLAIEAVDATLAGLLTSEHRDPFDRVIAAQAIRRNATVITPDTAFDTFPGVVRWWLQ